MAFQKRMTISELFCESIMRSCLELMRSGEIPLISVFERSRMDVLVTKLNSAA